MFIPGTTVIISRAAAFAGTLLLSFAVLNFLPSAKVRRQTNFARAAADGNLKQMRLLHMAGVSVNSPGACCSPLFLAAGARGSAAIYTEHLTMVHIIRKVLLRVASYLDYVIIKHGLPGGH